MRTYVEELITPEKAEVAALVVKAWNAYRTGRPVTNLRWRSGGSSPEAFPTAL